MTTALDIYSLATIPLELYANGNSIGRTATGFIWERRGRYYLITNWHAVTGCNAETGEQETCIPARPDMLRAHFNTRTMDFWKHAREISLRDDDHRPL